VEATYEPMPFNTGRAASGERSWENWTRTLPAWTPPRVPLLVIAPHPDDETLGAGGLIYTCLREGAEVTVISVSDGEAACPEVAALGEIRQGELSAALRGLGATCPNIIRMRIPDGQLGAHEEAIRRTISRLIRSNMLVVAPFEFDGHKDHDAAGRAAQRAVHDRSVHLNREVHLVRYPIWAWHLGSPMLRSARMAVRFQLDEESWSAKQHATDCFRSQLTERAQGAIVPPHVREYFTRRYEVFLL
jgi:LmbE family N-acetylglucosaminyl deacetylase